MTKFYSPSPVAPADAHELTSTFLTVVTIGFLNDGLAAIRKQKMIQEAQDKQMNQIYRQANQQKKARDAAQLPKHAKKHDTQQAQVYSKGFRNR